MTNFLYKKTLLLFVLSLTVLVSAQARRKPMIGVASGYSSAMVTTLNRSYTDAIYRAGGIPVILPQVNNAAEASEILSHLDGLLLSGGEDLAPAYYGESVLNETVSVNAHRDTIDVLYAEAALQGNKPILAICRGEQLLNVVLGGSLYQDLPSQNPSDIAHRQGSDLRFPSHTISVLEGSMLHKILGEKSLNVNTSHHQAVKVPSDKVAVTALAPDGVVEAYEGVERGEWILGVQFHPEQLVRADDKWLAIFKAFVKACK